MFWDIMGVENRHESGKASQESATKVGMEWLADVSHQLERARASVYLNSDSFFFFPNTLVGA